MRPLRVQWKCAFSVTGELSAIRSGAILRPGLSASSLDLTKVSVLCLNSLGCKQTLFLDVVGPPLPQVPLHTSTPTTEQQMTTYS